MDLRGVPLVVLAGVLLPGCNAVGPAALSNGRGAYNAVINQTEDQEILSLIVRQRYDETFGMLAVSSVTASLRVGAKIGGNVGLGPHSDYEGNLVPLSAEATYEENPTISYTPLRGEQFIQRMLGRITAEQAILLSRMSTDQLEVLRMLVRRANGLVNPVYSSRQVDAQAFDRFIELFVLLREQGRLDFVGSSEGGYGLLLHGQPGDDLTAVAGFLNTIGVHPASTSTTSIVLPLRFYVGEPRGEGLDLETPSAMEVIAAAAAGVRVPETHISDGIARPSAMPAKESLVDIHSSRERPSFASVVIQHHGWWFYIDARDARSKQAFNVLRTLIGVRMEDPHGQQAPVLTVPVGR